MKRFSRVLKNILIGAAITVIADMTYDFINAHKDKVIRRVKSKFFNKKRKKAGGKPHVK